MTDPLIDQIRKNREAGTPIQDRLRSLCNPAAETMPDGMRLTAFCHAGHDAADRIEADAEKIKRLEAVERAAHCVVEAYSKANPMRTADFHNEGCHCTRCEMDRLQAALNQKEGE